jgi:hypothetical protein
MQDEPKVFYSWQSQVSEKTNRTFIEDALERAVKILRNDATVEALPEIDQGAANVPGAPNIAEAILAKLDRATAIVFDVSLVPSNDVRPAPNANVLIELGYALKSAGNERMVLVMNTAYGKPEQLPFDLRQRHVVTYHLAEGDEKAEARKVLASKLEAKLRDVLALPSRSASPVELTVLCSKPTMHSDQSGEVVTHDYTAKITLTNTSKRRIEDWYVELEFPTPLRMPGTAYSNIVQARSNEKTTMLRTVGKQPLLVGDPFEYGIPYRVTKALYREHKGVMDQWVIKATAYVGGEQVAQTVADKIQNF